MTRAGLAALLLFATAAASSPPPTMPADHPPIGMAAPVGPRLPPATVVARYGGDTITAGDLDEAIAAMPAADRLEYNSAETVRDLAESLVDRRLMADRARREGLTGDAWLERELAKLPPPAEADIERYYREHGAEFTEPRRVRVTRVITHTEQAAERVRGELGRGASAEAVKASGAGEVAGADQLWLQQVPKQAEMTTVALALRRGEVSAVLPADNGFAVLRAEETVAARARPLDEVKPGITATLREDSRATAMRVIRERLREGIEVSVVEGALSSYAAVPAAPPAGAAKAP